ncbi:MAG: calcium/proton exchanger [Bacteriovoracaceae bacterium]|nr:calcium/proton exchanger [Bacteroidota bacterium]
MASFLKPSLNWLLIFVPVTIFGEYAFHLSPTLLFLFSCVSIVPLAGWLGRATEHLANTTGEGIGGLLNATFGNAAELIIALMAIQAGLYDVVKASITGSIIGNILLVLGAAFLAGGLKFRTQSFNATGARSLSTMLTLASIGLICPAVFHYFGGKNIANREADLSLEIAVVLVMTYGLSLLFSLKTHKQLFTGEAAEAAKVENEHHHSWSLGRSVSVLTVATLCIAWMSEILVGSIAHAAEAMGMTSIFVGVIVVAIIGNAAEHSTAILVALKNRMDLSLGIAIGSSVQVALFVAPMLVIASYFFGPAPMDLVFTPIEILAIALSALITEQIASDGESNWLEGVQLISVYIIFALVFYFLPA